jgi:hypothetical protein
MPRTDGLADGWEIASALGVPVLLVEKNNA